jgi:putative hydrolase of the HAD superfamily
MPQSARFIFFDVGNTLLFANRARILEPLRPRNISPTEEHLLRLEREVKQVFDEILEHGGKPDHGFWDMFYAQLFRELQLDDEPLRQQLIANTRSSANWDQIRPGTRESLQRIGQKYRLAVISNSDGKIKNVLSRCGLIDCFLTVTDSGIVGKEKPHPLIFETALESVGATAEQSLYVGDVYSADYRGATLAGMQAILFDSSGAYREKGLPRVESLQELEKTLE